MKRSKPLADPALDKALATYRIAIDTSESAVAALTRAARIRAVQLKDDLGDQGFFSLVAQLFGLKRASAAVWSAAAGMAFAAVIGLSVGASDSLTTLDETAFSIDFDSVLGSGALNLPIQAEQDL